MHCPGCHLECAREDTYCRRCGVELTEGTYSISLVPANTMLPAVLQHPLQRTVVAGVGALVLGVGIELLRRVFSARLARSATASAVLPALSGMKDVLATQHHEKLPRRAKKGYEIQEVVYIRRTVRF